ncbi:LysR family transcriptional regulator [Halotalea alkalilenta]|uniref:LysR family transcriptional regulator n=1 Tax=Halotalea alkalilenta TaxID=376489 RepID=UPI0004816277|nr:LysR family transcriptional regulator [Halotalea alkalilenta]
MERLECDRMLVAVLETGSFSKAAERLGISSAKASKLISRLESELGVQLIKRTTRALSPTEVGQAYFERIRALLEEFDDLDASVKNAAATPSGRLRISAPLSFGVVQLTSVLNEFALTYPEIQLEVNFSDRVVSLVDEGFDATLRIGTPADSSLIARRLCTARVVVVASPDYLKTHGTPVMPAELADHDCIIDTNFRDPYAWRFRLEGAPMTVAVKGRLRFSNAEASLRAAEYGLGIARVPSFIAGAALRDHRVTPLLAEHEGPPHGLFALYPPGRHLASKVRVLIDFLVERFPDPPEWDRGW